MADWRPSKRASQAITAAWEAFYGGDRWLRCEQASTARYTIESLRFHRWVEVDPEDKRRFRLSEFQLNQNGLTRSIPFFAGASLGEISRIQEAIEATEAVAARSI